MTVDCASADESADNAGVTMMMEIAICQLCRTVRFIIRTLAGIRNPYPIPQNSIENHALDGLHAHAPAYAQRNCESNRRMACKSAYGLTVKQFPCPEHLSRARRRAIGITRDVAPVVTRQGCAALHVFGRSIKLVPADFMIKAYLWPETIGIR